MIGMLDSHYTLSDLNEFGLSKCMLFTEMWICEVDSFNRDLFEHYPGDIDGAYYLSHLDSDENHISGPTSNDDAESGWWEYAYDDYSLIFDSNIDNHYLVNANHEINVPLLSEEQDIRETDIERDNVNESAYFDTLESNPDFSGLTRNGEQLRTVPISSHKDERMSIRYEQVLYGKTISQQLAEIPFQLFSVTLPSLSLIVFVFLFVMFSVWCCGNCFYEKRVISQRLKLSEIVIKSLLFENFGECNLQSIAIVKQSMPMSITH